MTIARVTHRHNYGSKPNECSGHIVGYYTTIEKARDVVKDFLGNEATCNNDFGFDIWVTAHLPNTEYIIDLIAVY